MLKKFSFIILLFTLFSLFCIVSLGKSRIKDIAHIRGVRSNQLLGYGLVVGLNGTGDKRQTLFTVQSLTNMLKRMGITVDPKTMKVDNVAAVMVTATLPPFARVGEKIDVNIASIGDADSLQGGVLLSTPLKGLDGKIYAMAQGPLILGGFSAGGTGNRVSANHTTTASIPNGAIVEREVPFSLQGSKQIVYTLDVDDFSSAASMAESIDSTFKLNIAKALDSRTVIVRVPDSYKNKLVDFISKIEILPVKTDQCAKIILNERTGTVVLGGDVRISPVAIIHGNLAVEVSTEYNVSQPKPFSKGQTTVTPSTEVRATEEKAKNVFLKKGATVEDLVRALNKIGATPRDVVSILMAIKSAGALKADIQVI